MFSHFVSALSLTVGKQRKALSMRMWTDLFHYVAVSKNKTVTLVPMTQSLSKLL